MSQEANRRIAYLLLRLAVGCSLFGHGLVRIPIVGSFHEHVTREFATSIVPGILVSAVAYALPFVECCTGALLILGLFTRVALVVGTLTMTVFIFGSTTVQNWSVIGEQLIHAAILAALIAALQHNAYSIDTVMRRRVMRPFERLFGKGVSIPLLGAAVIGIALCCIAPSAASPDDDEQASQRQQEIVRAFANAVVHDDHAGIAQNATPDIEWTIPGTSVISGRTTGIDNVLRLADIFATYGLHISPLGSTFGVDTVAVRLHDTGEHNGKRIDQDVINVLTIRDDKVAGVTATLTDVSSFDAYFS